MTLTEARAALCDLLLGRCLRWRAESLLRGAIWAEKEGWDHVDSYLDHAVRFERLAIMAERGLLCRVEARE